jgi:hypothetical protein
MLKMFRTGRTVLYEQRDKPDIYDKKHLSATRLTCFSVADLIQLLEKGYTLSQDMNN